MGIKAVLQLDMNCLGILAADRRRPDSVVSPLRANEEEAVATPHFRVGKLSVVVLDHHAASKAEGFLRPIQRGPGVRIEKGGDYGGASEWIIHGSTVTRQRYRRGPPCSSRRTREITVDPFDPRQSRIAITC